MSATLCRFCGETLGTVFCDLGFTPLANAFLNAEQLGLPEPCYPLCVHVCDQCFLVQLGQFETPEHIFGDYVYFSSYSETWLEHARRYTAAMIARFGLTPASRVVELASNDGYLLQYFKQNGVPVLGVEPASNVAAVAISKGVPTITRFFGVSLAQELVAQGWDADLLIANNVLAHVPDLNNFVAGIKLILKPRGMATIEVPHLLRLIEQCQFDTIYHEHFSYFSFLTLEQILLKHGLCAFDVEHLATHGGSLRVYAGHRDAGFPVSAALASLRGVEAAAGLHRLATYREFTSRTQDARRAISELLLALKRGRKSIAAYGAAAKGNTLLNCCGVGREVIDFVVDRSPHKQGRFLPGSHLPVRHPDALREHKPDYLLILPWNITEEITRQVAYIREWGGKFIIPIPKARVLP